MKNKSILFRIKERKKYWLASAWERYTPIITINTKYGEIRFFCMGNKTVKRVEAFHTKEPETLAWIDKFPEKSVFYDVGANIGTYSLYASLKPGIRILSFEPTIIHLFLLVKNMEINKKDNIIHPYCFAFNDTSELGMLNMPTTLMGKAGSQFLNINNQDSFRFYKPDSKSIFKQASVGYSMDDFISFFNAPFPAYIKIDVDGNEYKVLKGAEKTLRDKRLKSVLVEINPSSKDDIDNISSILESSGMKLVQKGKPQPSSSINHIFSRLE